MLLVARNIFFNLRCSNKKMLAVPLDVQSINQSKSVLKNENAVLIPLSLSKKRTQ